MRKRKAISVRGRGGLKDCEMFRILQCLDNRLTDGGKAYTPAALYSTETLFLCFCLFLIEAE
jgi:hypothetical protein